jgi:hypothetical protein
MEIILMGIVVIIVALIAYSCGSTWTRDRYIAQIVENLSKGELQRQFDESCMITSRQLSDPINSGIPCSEGKKHLEIAVRCLDKMNKMDGKEHGPSFRVKCRLQLLKEL